MTRRRAAIACAALLAGAGLATAATAAFGQPIDPARPATIVIGVPAGARADRIDVARTGLSRTPLPASALRVEWRVSTGVPLDHAPLVDARGTLYVVSARGEAIAVARDGTERWRVPTGAVDPGPPALLSDDTLVVIAAGDAVGLRDGVVRWRARVGVADPADPGPLPLDDGGVVVPAGHDLAVLDAEGHERTRTVLPEAPAAPLLWTLGRVVVVGASGTVWTWVPGAAEPARAATFGSRTEGGAALASDRTLIAVVAGRTSVASVDLLRGRPAVTRAIAPGGAWLGPPALRGEDATLAVLEPASELVVTVDASGRVLGRVLLAGHPPPARGDAGAPPTAGLTAPILVDRAGTVAFTTFDGAVGVAALGGDASDGAAARPALSPASSATDAAIEFLTDVCPRPGGLVGTVAGAPPPVAGLAPLPPASLLVACRSGTLVAVGTHGERSH
jgi:hypothetical protein